MPEIKRDLILTLSLDSEIDSEQWRRMGRDAAQHLMSLHGVHSRETNRSADRTVLAIQSQTDEFHSSTYPSEDDEQWAVTDREWEEYIDEYE